MPYVGNQPSGNFVQVTSQTITGNGGATYALDRPAGNSAEIEVFVNHVRQDPASYSVTGTSLTLGGNITSSDSCYVVFQSAGVGTVSHPATNNLQAADGTFTGDISGQALTATTGSFSGDLTVDRGTTHASAVVKGGNATTNYSGGSLLLANPGMATNYGGTYLYHHKAGGSGNTNAAFNISQRNASGGYVSNIWNVDYQNNVQSFYVPNGGISGAVALGINGSGHVTMPNQPAFFAHRNGGDWTTAVNQRIAFTSTKHNVGNGYSTSNYQFTAPVSGRYFFGGQMWAKNNGGMSRWHFEINGTHHGQFGSHAAPQDTRIGGSGVFNLSANDYVTMVTDQTGLTAHAGGTNSHSYFYGFLIG